MSTSLAVPETKKFETVLARLKGEAAAIVVRDPETCLAAKIMQRDIRNYLKDVHSALDPFVNMTKRSYDDARDERSKWLQPGELIDEALAGKVKDFERKEREKTAREEEERNRVKREAEARAAEEQRKQQEAEAKAKRAAEQKEIEAARKAGDLNKREAERMKKEAAEREAQERERAKREEELAKASFVPDKVAPQIPTVAGVPSRRNYKAEVTNGLLLLHAYVDAYLEHNEARVLYLRQFIQPNEQAIGAEARKVKNPKELERLIPGIRAFEE